MAQSRRSRTRDFTRRIGVSRTMDRRPCVPIGAIIVPAMVVAALGVAGCSSGNEPKAEQGSETATSTASCEPGIAPILCSTISLTGSVTIEGDSAGTLPLPNVSCEAWAAGDAVREDGPDKGMLELAGAYEPVNGSDFDVSTGISAYDGPGVYNLSQLSGLQGDTFAIVAGDAAFQADPKSVASINISADGSGELTFSGFTDNGTPEPDIVGISGTIVWSCVDPQ